MNPPIDATQASQVLADLLVGGFVDRVDYYITGWDLRVSQTDRDELVLRCSELRIPEGPTWEEALKLEPFGLTPGHEPEDTATAIAVFNVVNSVAIAAVRVGVRGTLVLTFEGGRVLEVPGVLEGIDWVWQLDSEQTNLVTCDSGVIFVNDEG